MKKIFCLVCAIIMQFSMIFPCRALAWGATNTEAAQTKNKTLEVTLTGYSILYRAYMESLRQSPSIRREWIENNQAMVYLTDTCFCLIETEAQNDFSNIIEVLHTSAPENDDDLFVSRCSMVSTIMVFDPDLGTDFIVDLVMNILPEKGDYVSRYCTYKYVTTANIIMLYISPR